MAAVVNRATRYTVTSANLSAPATATPVSNPSAAFLPSSLSFSPGDPVKEFQVIFATGGFHELKVAGAGDFVSNALGVTVSAPPPPAPAPAPPSATPRSVPLSLIAAPSGRWYEYFSDAFAEIGRPFNGSQIPDGFFLISALPAYVQIGSGDDVFPNEGNFTDVMAVQFNATGVGAEIVPVTGLTGDFVRYVAQDSTVGGEGVNYTTAFTNVNGVAQLSDGALVSLQVTATVTFSYTNTPLGSYAFSGPITINGNQWALSAGQPVPIGTVGYQWQLSGAVVY